MADPTGSTLDEEADLPAEQEEPVVLVDDV